MTALYALAALIACVVALAPFTACRMGALADEAEREYWEKWITSHGGEL